MSTLLQLSVVLLTSTLLVESATITREEFNTAVTKSGFKTPPSELYKYFVESASKYPKEEQAMLLAHILHDSQGFSNSEQQECLQENNKCADEYDQKYWGRGFIKIPYRYNYERASKALGLGDKLLREPELVVSDKRLAMLVSFWFWDTYVSLRIKGYEHSFGHSTFYINSDECRYLKYRLAGENRWEIYEKVAEAFGIAKKAQETGCYS